MSAALEHALPESLTLAQASAVLQDLRRTVEQALPGTPVVIEAAALKQLDTSALAVCLDLARQARAKGATLHLRHAPDKLVRLAQLYGVSELIVRD